MCQLWSTVTWVVKAYLIPVDPWIVIWDRWLYGAWATSIFTATRLRADTMLQFPVSNIRSIRKWWYKYKALPQNKKYKYYLQSFVPKRNYTCCLHFPFHILTCQRIHIGLLMHCNHLIKTNIILNRPRTLRAKSSYVIFHPLHSNVEDGSKVPMKKLKRLSE